MLKHVALQARHRLVASPHPHPGPALLTAAESSHKPFHCGLGFKAPRTNLRPPITMFLRLAQQVPTVSAPRSFWHISGKVPDPGPVLFGSLITGFADWQYATRSRNPLNQSTNWYSLLPIWGCPLTGCSSLSQLLQCANY